MSEEEDDLVGDKRAGAATYDRLMKQSVEKMLGWYVDEVLRGSISTNPKMKVAFAGFQNKGAEELGEWRDDLTIKINTMISESNAFTSISPRYVAEALRATNLSVDNLFLPPKRREFLAALERSDNPAQALVFATLTRGTTGQDNLAQANYRLTLEMVDSETGVSKSFDAVVRKEYQN